LSDNEALLAAASLIPLSSGLFFLLLACLNGGRKAGSPAQSQQTARKGSRLAPKARTWMALWGLSLVALAVGYFLRGSLVLGLLDFSTDLPGLLIILSCLLLTAGILLEQERNRSWLGLGIATSSVLAIFLLGQLGSGPLDALANSSIALALVYPILLLLPGGPEHRFLMAVLTGRLVGIFLVPAIVQQVGLNLVALISITLFLLQSFAMLLVVNEHARRRLRAAVEEAESAGRMRTLFVGAMSHDMRTSLNAIQGYATMLLADDHPSRPISRVPGSPIKVILEAAQALDLQVETLLSTAQVDYGTYRPTPDEVQPAALLRQLTSELALMANRRRVTIRAHSNSGDGAISLDRQIAHRVLGNLLKNAIQYTREGSTVQLLSDLSSATWTITVIDEGPGMTSREIESATAAFQRHAPDGPGPGSGVGLGLYSCSVLLDVLGAEMSFDSKPGAGTAVTVRFHSLAPPDQQAPAPVA